MEFDFEQWSRLARDDPEEFERRRRALIDQAIAEAPVERHERLRALQSRVDLERRRARTPLGACVRISNMMWQSFERMRGELASVVNGTPPPPAPRRHGQVLPFVRHPEQGSGTP